MVTRVVSWSNGDVAMMTIKKILLKKGKIYSDAKAWKPIGDGRTTCVYCGKNLTDELSFARGVGPECIKKRGPWKERSWIEPHVKAYQRAMRKLVKEEKQFIKVTDWMEQEGIEIPKSINIDVT